MSLPFAAVGALVAALLETSVFPYLSVAGAKPDLVFVLAVVSAMMVGVEDGLVWASLGGLMLDMLLLRPVGATMLALLIVVGLAVAIARVVGPNRIVITVLAVFSLAFVYQIAVLAILAVSTGISFSAAPLGVILPIAFFDMLVAVLVALAARWAMARFGPADRLDW